MLLSTGVDCSMAIVNLTTRNDDSWQPPARGPVRFAAFSPDNSTLPSGGFDGTIYLWAFSVVTGD